MEQGFCPKCGKALSIPDGLAEFSCLYCGERLTLPQLLRQPVSAADSAADYLRRLSSGTLEDAWTPEDYLTGNYTHKVQAPAGAPGKKDDLGLHHAGAAVKDLTEFLRRVQPQLLDDAKTRTER